MTAILLAIAAGSVLLALLVHLERRGRPEVAVTLILIVVLAEMLLYPSQNDVEPGLFRFTVGSEAIRLHEVLIGAALVARLVGRGLPRRFSAEGMAWAVFLGWYTTSFAVGLLYENEVRLALFQLKTVLYVGGGLVLAAGIPVERFVRRRTLSVSLTVLGVIVAASAGPTMASGGIELGGALFPGATLGLLGADVATALVSVGTMALLVEAARRRGRQLHVILAGLGLLLVPFLISQRAAFLGLAACLVLIIAVATGSTWRRRMSVTLVELVLLIALLSVPVIVGIVVSSMAASEDPEEEVVAVPFADRVNESFFAERKQQSAEIRRNLWSDGLGRVRERPFVGSGLGAEYEVERPGGDATLVGEGFHNVLLDVVVRAGLAGLGLLLIACAVTVSAAVRVWRRHPDPVVAALAMGAVVALAGILAKGMVESVFEKYRLALLIGVLLGAIGSAADSERRARVAERRRSREAPVLTRP